MTIAIKNEVITALALSLLNPILIPKLINSLHVRAIPYVIVKDIINTMKASCNNFKSGQLNERAAAVKIGLNTLINTVNLNFLQCGYYIIIA